MGTTTLEANLAHHLDRISHKTLLQVFLDVLKAYDLLYRRRCLEILRGYSLGLNLAYILKNYWNRQRIFPKAGKCLETSFKTGREVIQGYRTSPIIFTIVVNLVVRVVIDAVLNPQEAYHGMGWGGWGDKPRVLRQ